jgi:hypothetical protein
MPDSNPMKPSEEFKPRSDQGGYDDESIDLGRLEPVEDGASALSFSGRSATRTAGSSAVRSWEQVVQDTASESGVLPIRMPSADEIELASDTDLLKEVLADEPSPSKIVLKDPTNGEVPALPAGGEPKSGAFELPPELATSRAGDSSILTSHGSGVGLDGSASDVWGSSSRVDLLGPHGAPGADSGSLQLTEKMQPRVNHSVHDDSSVLAHAADGGHASSTVDLGSQSDDATFPLESGVSARAVAKRRPAVAVASTPVVGGSRFALLAGGAVAGLFVGFAVCAGLWWAGILPDHGARPSAANGAGDWPVRLQASERARAEEAKKTAGAVAETQRLRGDSQRAAAGAADARRAEERARTLSDQVKRAEASRDALKTQFEQLTAARAADESRVREADAGLTELRERLRRAETDARMARQRADEADATGKQAAELAAEIARRLATRDGAPATVLAALDRALARATEPPATSAPGSPGRSEPAVTRPEQTDQAFHAGIAAYRSGQASAAEREFALLAASAQANAVHLYYLGLAQLRQGRGAEADESLRRGWELERVNRPSPAEVEAAFERCDRADRDLVNRFRR